MKRRKLIKNNSALAGVIEALLIIALVAIILSVIQLQYIPIIVEQKEADHMDKVENQFSTLKSVIETQAMMGVIGSDQSLAYSPMSSPVTLGSKKLPYFVSGTATGQLTLKDKNDVGNYKINIQPMSIPEYSSGIPLTSIEYQAYNTEFINQKYVLEGGGVILNQSDGEVMRVDPSMTVENHSESGYIKIYWYIPVFTGFEGKKTDAGWEDTYVRTNYSKHSTQEGAVNWIYIYTPHIEAWNKSLIQNDTGILWEYYHNGYINVYIDYTETPHCIKIEPQSKNIQVALTVVEIGVQIGHGEIIT
ncbi:MAG: hypothetical protein DRM99_03240 [Thermoplasmata archaeon]|nr:MAG: hypothetical protein DRM99_03240 [Thermoplasmata archaeon]